MADAEAESDDRSVSDGIPATSDGNGSTATPQRPGITIVGEECAKAGITPDVLWKGWESDQARVVITKMMVAEIEAYRLKKKETYDVARQWLGGLMGEETLAGSCKSSFQTSLKSLKEKWTKLKQTSLKKGSAEKLQALREEEYHPPTPRQAAALPAPLPSTSRAEKKLEAVTQANLRLKDEVRNKDVELKKLYGENFQLQKDVKQTELRQTKIEKDERQIKQDRELLKKEASKVKGIERNLTKKIKRRDSKIEKMEKEAAKRTEERSMQDEQSMHLAEELQQETRRKEQYRKRYTYHQSERSKEREKLASVKTQIKLLKKEKAQLITNIQHLELELELEASGNRQIQLREGPHPTSPYTNDVRACCMKLFSHEVSANNMSNVIHAVLTTLCKYNISVDDLPGVKFCQLIREEAGLASDMQLAEEMESGLNMTAQSDGTTRDGQKYADYEITTAKGQHRLIGILEMPSGESADQLEGLKFILDKIARLTNSIDNNQYTNRIISKIKNTMGDGAASQKHFNQLLQTYRQDILPEVIENWEMLEESVQQDLITMNHMYCQLHALIGFATYSDEALRELEDLWRVQEKKLGVENLREFQNKDGEYTWGKGDSATQRLIRTTCDAIGPRGNQQAGCMGEFETYLALDHLKLKRTTHLKSFKGNRFNILFECGAGVFHHSKHVRDMFENGYHKAGNRLLRAVLADISSLPLLSGCRALGLVFVHITEPYWRLVTDAQVHILDLSKQLQHAVEMFRKWSQDATPLLDPDLPPLFFKGEHPIEPHREAEVYKSLYNPDYLQDNTMTRQALEVVLQNMITVCERRFHQQLHGQYKDGGSETQRQEMQHMLKTNMKGENDFGYFSYLQSSKPSISIMSLEAHLDTFIENLSNTTKTVKVKALKAHITHLKPNSKCPPELFRFSADKKQFSIEQLTSNLRTIIQHRESSTSSGADEVMETDDVRQPTEDVEDGVSRIKATLAMKADEEESDEEEDEPPAKKMRPDSFELNHYVAVAFEDAWYLGQVESVEDGGQEANVNFMQRKMRRRGGDIDDSPTFFWPDKKSVETIDIVFVLDSNIQVEKDKRCNGRGWTVSGSCKDVNMKYNKYYNENWARKINSHTKKKGKKN
ncbi:hypothetical protein Bbelb_118540 [Branchiostoma belcheri]|nr:hypothetical protein Bbelb_118540 [Branchiostoma belcheri]